MARRLPGLRCSFEPADIINEVMSFGSPSPVEVVVSGPKLADDLAFANKIQRNLEGIPALRDLQRVQAQDYPTYEVTIDRRKAGVAGVSARDVTRSLLAATASTRYVAPNYWADPNTGQGYIVQLQVPTPDVTGPSDLEMVPVRGTFDLATSGGFGGTPLLRDVATVREGTTPARIDRFNMRRSISLVANVAGSDLGAVDKQVRKAVADAGTPPKGVTVAVRGQLEPLGQITQGLTAGLGLAVACIVLLLTAYFQSIRLAVVSVFAVPAVLAGVGLALVSSGAT